MKPENYTRLYLILLLCLCTVLAKRNENAEYWKELNRKELLSSLKKTVNTNKAKNIIFCVGDGLGLSTITAMRQYKTEVEGRIGDMDDLYFEQFPNTGLLKAYTTTQTIADSASSATAYMTGVRTKTYLINVDDRSKFNDCASHQKEYEHDPITKTAKESGRSVGMVTTSRITHATPATAYGNAANRWWEADYNIPRGFNNKCPDLSRQFVERGDHMDVMMAGGRAWFLPRNETDPELTWKYGKRTDGRNLIKEWTKIQMDRGLNATYVYDYDKFSRIDPQRTDKVLGLFEYSHMNYEADRKNDLAGEPSLSEMTEKTIRILSKNKNGFFLFLEGARIDHGHHYGLAKYAITDGLEFERAIRKAAQMTNPNETLIIVTGDHSHSMHIVGYKKRETPLFGLSDIIAKDGMPYTTILYSIGPGYNHSHPTGRQNLTGVDTEDMNYHQQSAVPNGGVNHSGEDVTVYAKGPWSHLIQRLTEQTYLHEVMLYAACMGHHATSERCITPAKRASATVKNLGGQKVTPNVLLLIFLVYSTFSFSR